VEDCAEHLTSTLCDHNVMERWLLADKSQVHRLRYGALKFLAERSIKTPINHIPGLMAAFDSNHRHLRDLLLGVSAQKDLFLAELGKVNTQLDEANAKLEARDKENTDLKQKLAEEKKKIAVKVDRVVWSRSGNSRLDWSELITCNVTDTVQFVIDALGDDDIVGLAWVDDNPGEDDWLENDSTLEECHIYHNVTLYAYY